MDYDIDSVRRAIILCADKAINSKPMLTLLDSCSGDGDMGISMEKGSVVLKHYAESYTGDNIGELFVEGGMLFNKAASSTIGTLVSSAMLMTGKKLYGRTRLDDRDLLQIPTYMSDAIILRGNAKLGDKTILDALIPFSDELRTAYEELGSMREAADRAARAAKTAAKNTKGVVAKIGRAKWIGERSKEFPDAGAVMCALLADSLAHPQPGEGYKLPKYE